MILSNPVYRWNTYGDAISNAISSVGKGAWLPVSGQFNIWVHNGTIDYTSQTSAFDSVGRQVGFESYTSENSTDVDRYVQWESFVTLDTTGWDSERHTGEFIVRDDILEKKSDAGRWSVEIVAPLSGAEAVLVDSDIPSAVQVNQTFDYSLTLENRSDRDSSIVSPVSRRTNRRWTQIFDRVSFNIPGGESVEFLINGASLADSGVYEYRLDAVGITWKIFVSDA